jgi:methyl-accepting chemotaxis protein
LRSRTSDEFERAISVSLDTLGKSAAGLRTMSESTAKATDEISSQVAAMQGATSEAVQAIEKIGGTISSIHGIATSIASAVEQQGAATREIARSVQQAAEGNGQVSHNPGVTQYRRRESGRCRSRARR